ncbi:MAG: glutamine--fructose-6-phosphate transaminase (isomerizing) [Legionellaceae bacterium]|nr:glutamine--fructose-6-phosphate transaminase (isomerizing) [Legionellaceae bacterium]
MCGIIGTTARRDISSILLEGLKRLEYRGYDSAGMALIDDEQQLIRVRTNGKVQTLAKAVQLAKAKGQTGIAHTRWATHGKPCENNAHPHISHDVLAVVHNGIIENHEPLRRQLQERGYCFLSETDTEIAAHLIHFHYQKQPDLLLAVQAAAAELEGAFALGVIHQDHPEQLVAVRKGSPLVVGIGHDEHYIASDSLALAGFAFNIIYLEEGDSLLMSADQLQIYNSEGERTTREPQSLSNESNPNSKGTYRHFMLKEIYEQSRVLTDTLEGRTKSPDVVRASFGEHAVALFPLVKHIHIVACGTSYHAGLVAKYWLEALAGIPTQVEIASEYRYRDVVVSPGTLFIAVSQSGETADTLAALHKAKTSTYLTSLSICNVPSSSLVRAAESSFFTRAGIEIGVASTKAFTTQLVAFLLLAVALNQDERGLQVLEQLQQLPAIIDRILDMDSAIQQLTPLFVNKAHTLFLGRGVQYPIALEGALKMKELSYIHAEAYPAGELKHGPLALVDEEMPVIAVAPNDELLHKLKSNLHEVSARGGKLIVFVDDGHEWQANGAALIRVPPCGNWVAPVVYTIPLQLLAYHVAVAKGTDVDQPRNLAKSVTVE